MHAYYYYYYYTTVYYFWVYNISEDMGTHTHICCMYYGIEGYCGYIHVTRSAQAKEFILSYNRFAISFIKAFYFNHYLHTC